MNIFTGLELENVFLSGGTGHFECPACGGSNLHHSGVEVWVRREDSRTGLRVVVDTEAGGDTGTFYLDKDMSANPSKRRGGMKILFWCETCPAKLALYIVQHKGNEFGAFGVANDKALGMDDD